MFLNIAIAKYKLVFLFREILTIARYIYIGIKAITVPKVILSEKCVCFSYKSRRIVEPFK